MIFWTHLIGNYYLATVLYVDGDRIEPDGHTFHNGPHGPEIPDSLVSSEMQRWVEREFEEHGADAFNLAALYRLQTEEDSEHAA